MQNLHAARPRATFSMTYDCVTHESAQHGYTSEKGWVRPGWGCDAWEDEDGYHDDVLQAARAGEYDLDLQTALEYARDMGCTEVSHQDGGVSVYSADRQVTDWQAGEETSYCLHVENVSPGTVARILRYLGAK